MSKLKSMNKLFAILLIFTFMAGIVSTGMPVAFAKEAKDEVKVDVKKLTSDIEDKNTKEAVLRLAAFGIINGLEDGKYHPEDKVTREQFAKILVTSLKMESAAQAGLGFAHFKDVDAGRWSAGYIGIAAGHGLIKGYPDGTFKPAAEVSYAEAVTMLVRALGYKDEFLSGTWPANYLAKAAEKEITKKVKFSNATGFADRGDVAILVNNTLDAKVIEVETYEGALIKYKESEETLLENKLNIEKEEDARVIANKRIDDGLKEYEVRLGILPEKKSKEEDRKEKDYDFLDGVNPELHLGEEVNAYFNDDDEVIYLEKTDNDKVYFDYVKKAITDKDKKYIKALDLAKADDDFEFDEDALIYVLDGDKYKAAKLSDNEISLSDYNVDDFAGHVGKFVIKNRKIIYAEIMDMGEAKPWMVVMENKDNMLKGICGDDDEFELDLTKDGNYDGVIVLDLEGYELDVKDIEKGNLVYAQKQSYDGDDYAVVRVVKDNTLEGKLDRVQENKVKVGSVEKNVTHYTNADGKKVFDSYYSVDGGEEVKIFGKDNSEFIDDMDDADDEEIIAYTDAVGRVAYFITEAEATSGYRYGIVTRTYADNDRLKVFTITEKGDDDEFVYRVEEDDDVEYARVLDEYGRKLKDSDYKDNKNRMKIKEGSVIKFKFNKDGEIAEDKLYVMDPANLWKMTSDDGKNDFGSDYLPKAYLIDTDPAKITAGDFGGAKVNFATQGDYHSFSVDDNVVIIDAEGYEFDEPTSFDEDKASAAYIKSGDKKFFVANINKADDFAKGNWKDLSKSNGTNLYFYIFADDDKAVNAKSVVFIGNASGSAANDEIGIYALKVWYKGGDTYIDYVAYGDNKVESRIVDKGDKEVKKERPYIAKVKSNGKIDIISTADSKDDFSVVTGVVDTRKSDSITLKKYFVEGDKTVTEEAKMFNISSKTVVYEEDNKKNTSNLVSGDVVLMVVEKGTNARVIERLIDSEKSKALKELDGEITDGGKTTLGDATFSLGKDSKATLNTKEDASRSVTVEVYADFDDKWKVAKTDIKDENIELDRNSIKASGISARSVSSPTYDSKTNIIKFTAVFTDYIFDGDTLEILDKAIVVTGETTKDGKTTKQTATVKKGEIDIKK